MELRVRDAPFVAFAAPRAAGQHPFVADAQQGFELAFDTDVDRFAGVRTIEVQTFHGGLHSVARSISILLMQIGTEVAFACFLAARCHNRSPLVDRAKEAQERVKGHV